MKIQSLTVLGLHGYISFDLTFFQDLTFLIGINGSGKTSAVRAIMALLTPAVRDLARLEFERLEVTITNDGEETIIDAERNDSEISLGIKGMADRLTIPILPRPAFGPRISWEEHALEYYREQEALHARHPVLAHLSSLPTPMFLDLERRAQVSAIRRSVGARLPSREAHMSATLLSGTLLESLRDAQSIAEAAFRANLAQQRQLADGLKQDLIVTHFQAAAEDGRDEFSTSILSKEAVKKLKQRQRLLNASLSAIGMGAEEITKTVAGFFDEVYRITERLRGKQLLELLVEDNRDAQLVHRWLALLPQMGRINSVIEHVERYNREIDIVIRPIERYLELVNNFLKDSGKRLVFSPTGDLRISIVKSGIDRAITALSSGERQLVVILTHLLFNEGAKRANVLIIDEPELSLHIRWQEQFVDALQGASDGLQLILATHSPSIIMERVEQCVDVQESRS